MCLGAFENQGAIPSLLALEFSTLFACRFQSQFFSLELEKLILEIIQIISAIGAIISPIILALIGLKAKKIDAKIQLAAVLAEERSEKIDHIKTNTEVVKQNTEVAAVLAAERSDKIDEIKHSTNSTLTDLKTQLSTMQNLVGRIAESKLQ